jgi:hypothetical protein
VPLTIEVASLEQQALPSVPELAGASVGQAVPAPVASQVTGTAIPLPPGVAAGLIGLASAAVARRHYLKRR